MRAQYGYLKELQAIAAHATLSPCGKSRRMNFHKRRATVEGEKALGG
jgi:hypothetical protein